MGYENAPATKMLATHCSACGRPLVDAKSVELGIGPDCRKKFAFTTDVPEPCRRAANKLVYEIALEQGGIAVLKKCAELRDLGFPVLADRIEQRCAALRLMMSDNELRIISPYNPEFVYAVKKIPGARWHKELKSWSVPINQRAKLWAALCLHYAGALAVGPKGPFQVAA